MQYLGLIKRPSMLQLGRYPRFAPENLAANAAKVARVAALAEERGVTAAQLSLAWVQSQGVDVVPIPVSGIMKQSCTTFASSDLVDSMYSQPARGNGPRSVGLTAACWNNAGHY